MHSLPLKLASKQCSQTGCEAELGSRNTSGLCRKHRHRAPSRKASCAVYVFRNRGQRSAAAKIKRLEDPGKARQAVTKSTKTPKGRFSKLRQRAKSAALELSITEEAYYKITEHRACSYCGGPLPESGHGLDRLDNDKGYTPENVVPCCGHCNRLRSNCMSSDETRQVVRLLKSLRGTETIWTRKNQNPH